MGESREKKSQPAEAATESAEAEESVRERVEEALTRFIPEVLRRTYEVGLETISRTDKSRIKNLVTDLKLPREVAKYFLVQVDETKNALLRVFAKEVREFLENTDLADDMRKVLTSVSLEVSTRVRFVPNEASGGIKPQFDSKVKMSERGSPQKTSRPKDANEE